MTAATAEVFGLAVRGADAYAATSAGLFESTDSGVTWTQISAVTGGAVAAVATTPDGRVVAGTATAIWISDTAAAT